MHLFIRTGLLQHSEDKIFLDPNHFIICLGAIHAL